MDRYEQFQEFRTRLNEKILGAGGGGAGGGGGGGGTLVTKRFFALDDQTYRDTSGETPPGLDKKTKELLGLAASMVLRCDDCIAYHIDQCVKAGCSDRELWETFDVALIVGGSIVIPHLRRGVEFLELARKHAQPGQG
jgi:AhpD family alkylhydroperoxidase